VDLETQKRLMERNKNLKTVDIKGKKYVEVNTGIQVFRDVFPDSRQETEVLAHDLEKGIILMKVKVYENSKSDKPIAEGVALEKESSSFINKTSYVENCETSAFGRALGNLGIGIDTSVASYEEVANAIENQKDKREWQVTENIPLISTEQVQILKKTAEKYNLSDEKVKRVLNDLGYKSFEEVKFSDYAKIGNIFNKG
jgi:hypothetical protein